MTRAPPRFTRPAIAARSLRKPRWRSPRRRGRRRFFFPGGRPSGEAVRPKQDIMRPHATVPRCPFVRGILAASPAACRGACAALHRIDLFLRLRRNASTARTSAANMARAWRGSSGSNGTWVAGRRSTPSGVDSASSRPPGSSASDRRIAAGIVSPPRAVRTRTARSGSIVPAGSIMASGGSPLETSSGRTRGRDARVVVHRALRADAKGNRVSRRERWRVMRGVSTRVTRARLHPIGRGATRPAEAGPTEVARNRAPSCACHIRRGCS